MASKPRNMFQKNKTQETTEKGHTITKGWLIISVISCFSTVITRSRSSQSPKHFLQEQEAGDDGNRPDVLGNKTLELWGSAKKSNIDRIQAFQSKVLRTILDAPWYVSNRTAHHDLNIPTVQQFALNGFHKFDSSLDNHSNSLVNALSSLSHPLEPPCRLKRRLPRDLFVE
ncbi:hypothetical protein AAG570_004201 [Ranatra chinensis]|uniref:Uncharacterized protein n=1 Tax=Ranatra chinensis TaxID=642074 RepID=A0ABD0YFN2_9HEMI